MNSTIECPPHCGWTTTSIWSKGVPNSSWASITLRPLFIRVVESTVIFGPIAHVGWARASSIVTAGSVGRGPPAERAAAGGQHHARHLAVRRRRRPQALVAGAGLAVDRDQLGARGRPQRLHHRAGRR